MVTKSKIIKKRALIIVCTILVIFIHSITVNADQTIQQPINQTSKKSIPQPKLPLSQPTTQKQQSSSDQQPYLIELQVNNEGEEERKQIFVKALEQVLIKNSNNQIVTLPTIKTALTKPDIYIQRYTYINRNNIIGKPSLFLQIQFDQTALTQLLQKTQTAQVEDTINNKTQTLIWLVKAPALGNKIIVDESSNDAIVATLQKNAQDFGISIMLPVSDLQDVNRIKVADICNLNAATIKNASRRYGVNTILAGCLKQPTRGNVVWSGHWLLLRNNKIDILTFTGATAENVIMQTIRAIVPDAVTVEEPIIKQPEKLILRITNVKGLEQYSEVVRYLTKNSQVTQVDLVKIGTTEIELSVDITGELQTLLATFAAQNKLIRNTNTTILPPGVDLDYKWVNISNEQTQATSAKPVP